MNHYKARKICSAAVEEFVSKLPDASYKDFVRAMDLKYGIGESMIRKKLLQYDIAVVNGQIQRVDT
jgi:hypothetical protein